MRRLAAILALVLGLTLLAAPPASAAVAAHAENRTSGSAAGLTTLIEIETRLSEEAVRENILPRYDFASDDAVAARAGGRLGGTAHRATVAERAAQLEREGHTITAGGGRLPERSVITPEGKRRFPDISSRDPSGNPYHENVGRSTASGDPIARERRALDDIRRATGTEPGYTPYDR